MCLSNCRNGTNSGHADSHSLMIAGYRSPNASVSATNASRAADSLGAPRDQFMQPADAGQSLG